LQDNEDVMLVIFFFNTSVNENIYEQNLSMDVPEEIFTKNRGGPTQFGPPLRKAIDKVQQYIENKEFAKIYFFTDGEEDYPNGHMNRIEQQI